LNISSILRQPTHNIAPAKVRFHEQINNTFFLQPGLKADAQVKRKQMKKQVKNYLFPFVFGSVPMYLQMIDSITSSAPPPMDGKR